MATLAYGVGTPAGTTGRRICLRVGDECFDLAALAADHRWEHRRLLAGESLNPLMAAGPGVWDDLTERAREWVSARSGRPAADRTRLEAGRLRMWLPFEVADYTDFYASEQHATNAGRILRPGGRALPEQWRQVPLGYHGRAGTVVVSGTPVTRPCGLYRDEDGPVRFGPTRRLDLEAEVGFVVGVGSRPGRPVPVEDFQRHVFGVCLVNDWSARDVQRLESVPLGPFLGKSFQTSVSAWIVPVGALDWARVVPPDRDPVPAAYLRDDGRRDGYDLTLRVRLGSTVLSRPPFAGMYWTAAQQLAHLTVNGAPVRTGDLFASGTVSGPRPDQFGSLLELSWGGVRPVMLADGSRRVFLEDGDEVEIDASAAGPEGTVVHLGSVIGRVQPAGSTVE